MRAAQYLAFLSMAALVVAQDPGPSPTESVGCEPHGDHWHCDGPAETEVPAEDPGPSPTESVGCEPHGDHWHCDGPSVTPPPVDHTSSAVLTTTAAEDDHDHDHDHGTETPAEPSPTESIGCEPHGDHWHCEGPATDSSTLGTVTTSPTANGTVPAPVPTAGAMGGPVAGLGAVIAAAGVAVLF